MELTSADLALWLKENKPLLEGAYFNKVQELGEGLFKFKLSTKDGSKDLFFIPGKVAFFSSVSLTAPKNPSQASLFLRSRIENMKILSVEQKENERVLVLGIRKGEVTHHLILELFAKGNLILADDNWKMSFVLNPHEWKDRNLKRGQTYKFPPSSGIGREPSKQLQGVSSVNDALEREFLPLVEGMLKPEDGKSGKISSLEHRLTQQEEAIKKFGKQSEEFKRKGDSIYENHGLVEEILGELKKARENMSWKELEAKLRESKTSLAEKVKSVKPKEGKIVISLD